MSDLLIKNGRVIDPANGVDEKCDLLVVDGCIAEVAESIDLSKRKDISENGRFNRYPCTLSRAW